MARRILRVKIDALTPGTKTYSKYNSADKNANITLSESDFRAASAVATNQAVRGTIAFETGKSYYIEVLWNSGTELYVGVGNSSESLNVYPGGGTNSWSCRASTGQIYQNATPSASGPACSVGGTIGMMLRWSPKNKYWSLHFRTTSTVLNMSVLNATYFSGLGGDGIGGTLYLMVGSTTAFDATVKTGEVAFTYDVPDGPLPGQWTQVASSSSPQYFASEGYVSHSNSTPASTLYEGRVSLATDPTLTRAVSAWPWGTSSSASSIGDILLSNEDGGLDYLKDLIVRDRTITIEYAENTSVDLYNQNTWSTFAIGIMDRFDSLPNRTMKLVLADKMLLTDKPLSSAVFPTWLQEESLRESPKPVCIGTAYSCDALRVEPNLQYYDVHDDAVFAVDEVRDMGDLDVLTTDYTVRNTGFDKVHTPVGKVTAGIRGALKRDTATFTDNFTSWVAGAFNTNPTSWTVAGESSANECVYERTSGRCAMKKSGGGTQLSMERAMGWSAGTSTLYIVTIAVTYFAGTSMDIYTSNGAGTYSSRLHQIDTYKQIGTHSFLITPTAGQTHLHLRMNASTTNEVEMESLIVYPATHISNISDFAQELLVARGGLSATTDVDTTSLATINTETEYSYGYFSPRGGSIKDVLKQLVDSVCGWVIPNYDGKLTFGRLKEPSVTPALTLTKYTVQDDVTCGLDRAPSLTTTIGSRKNWTRHADTDLAGSVSSTTKELLKREMRFVKSKTGVVDPVYVHADAAEVRQTLFSAETDADYEAQRLAGLYFKPRYFYEVSALMNISNAIELNPGDTIALKYPRFDLASGKNLLVVGITVKFSSNVVKLKLWG